MRIAIVVQDRVALASFEPVDVVLSVFVIATPSSGRTLRAPRGDRRRPVGEGSSATVRPLVYRRFVRGVNDITRSSSDPCETLIPG
jgi:hypothetical protein